MQCRGLPPPAPPARGILSGMRWLLAILMVFALGATTQPAFIRQMIYQGTPQLAEAQARELIASGSNDPLAIGVMAQVYLDRGEIGAAIQQLKLALMGSADENFLLRLAGQVVAWNDSQVDRTRLTATDAQMLEWIRKTVAGRPAFAEVYKSLVTPPPFVPPPPQPQVVVVQQPVVHERVIYERRRYDDDHLYYPYPYQVFVPRHVRPQPPQYRPPPNRGMNPGNRPSQGAGFGPTR
jgi:hypothetical protein